MSFEQPSRSETFMWSVKQWRDAIQEADTENKLIDFNDVLGGKEAPSPDQQKHLILRDVTIGDKICDVYHWGQEEGSMTEVNSSARVYLHYKN